MLLTTHDLQDIEAKFQLSFKTKFAENVFGDNGDVWMGYTQSSRWQVYNGENSRPFRETNYEPEVMLVFRNNYRIGGWNGRLAGIGINHQSNGRSDPLSRRSDSSGRLSSRCSTPRLSCASACAPRPEPPTPSRQRSVVFFRRCATTGTAASSSSSVRTTRMPRPPPPAEALISTGSMSAVMTVLPRRGAGGMAISVGSGAFSWLRASRASIRAASSPKTKGLPR